MPTDATEMGFSARHRRHAGISRGRGGGRHSKHHSQTYWRINLAKSCRINGLDKAPAFCHASAMFKVTFPQLDSERAPRASDLEQLNACGARSQSRNGLKI